jgi:hypothetical protein
VFPRSWIPFIYGAIFLVVNKGSPTEGVGSCRESPDGSEGESPYGGSALFESLCGSPALVESLKKLNCLFQVFPELLLNDHILMKMTETHRSQIAQLKRKITSSHDVHEMFVKYVSTSQSAYAKSALGIQICPHFPKCLCQADAWYKDVLLRQCMKYIRSITPLNQLADITKTTITKPPICFGTYPIVADGNLKTVEMRGDYDCHVIILKNTETNDFTLDIDALEKMTELREIRFQFIQKYMPGVNTAIHLVKMGQIINYYAFIGWCSRRRIRLSMTIGGQPVTVDWKAVFF